MLLKPALIERRLKAPTGWHHLPHGDAWQRALTKALKPHWGRICGDYLVQLGALSCQLEQHCKMTEIVKVHTGDDADVQAHSTALPFQRRSIDAVIMAHVLEYEADPHQVLREVDRMLAFDGHLILTSYNPFSLASLTGLWPANRDKAPWRGRYFSPARLHDWLGLLNFEIIHSGYALTSSLRKGREVNEDTWLSRQFPQLGAVHYLIARKRVYPLTPTRQRQAMRQSLTNVAAAQARVQSKAAQSKSG